MTNETEVKRLPKLLTAVLMAGCAFVGYNVGSYFDNISNRYNSQKIEQRASTQPRVANDYSPIEQIVSAPIIDNHPTLQNIAQPINKLEQRLNYKTTDFSEDSDRVMLARMLFGEARNCSNDEMALIAYTAINRANDRKKWNGESVRESILVKSQYSCFNANDPNRVKLMDPEKYDSKAFERCLKVAEEVLSGKDNELNFGQTHYHTPAVSPIWKNDSTMHSIKSINSKQNLKHIFYKED